MIENACVLREWVVRDGAAPPIGTRWDTFQGMRIGPEVLMLDDVSTWPPDALKRIDERAPEYLADPNLDGLEWDDVAILVDGMRLRAYHLTRLLPHEEVNIRERGLETVTVDLLERRIDEAEYHGCISDDDAHDFRTALAARMDGDGAWLDRMGELHLLMTLSPVRGARAVDLHYIREWGGEAFTHAAHRLRDRLRQIGREAIVVLDLHLDPWNRADITGGALTRWLLATWTQTPTNKELAMTRSLRPSEVVGILHRGDPAFDDLKIRP